MAWYNWSQTPAANATADSTINWQEGQAPSSINDSARAMMAATAKYRDDIAGAIVTSGTSTAYTVSSYSVYDTLAHLAGQMIAFTPHTTNGGFCSLNVDGLGPRNIRSAPGVDIPAGTIIQGTPYVVTYNNTDGMFYLQGFYGNPYNIPLGGGLDFWGPTAPNSSFVLPFGQAISRTTYSALFAVFNTIYGSGDGSSTFNLPDLRGRVVAAVDNMGGVASNRLALGSIASLRFSLGGAGGADTHTLSPAEMPTHTHPNWISDPGHYHAYQYSTAVYGAAGGGSSWAVSFSTTNTSAATTNIVLNNASQGGSVAHDNLQPTILCNYILRII